ncbi:hypothetical protein RB195_016764 [Necator americanus]|uniref:Uncharacterized protein n=1 Tax=Necator americanus TaxID=51031 RepID=A0ABR1C215_NECAM
MRELQWTRRGKRDWLIVKTRRFFGGKCGPTKYWHCSGDVFVGVIAESYISWKFTVFFLTTNQILWRRSWRINLLQ